MTEVKKNFAPTIISCIVVMVVVVTLFVNKVTTETRLTVDELKDLGMYSIDPPRELGDFELVTSSGSRFIPSDFRGNWNFLFFGFTFCPDICPITIQQLPPVTGLSPFFSIISFGGNPFLVRAFDSPGIKSSLINDSNGFSSGLGGLGGLLDTSLLEEVF